MAEEEFIATIIASNRVTIPEGIMLSKRLKKGYKIKLKFIGVAYKPKSEDKAESV